MVVDFVRANAAAHHRPVDVGKLEVQEYLGKYKAYKRYLRDSDEYQDVTRKNRDIQEANKRATSMWYALSFGVGIYSGLAAWFFNRKIRLVESALAELSDDLSIKSKYAKLLHEIFDGSGYRVIGIVSSKFAHI